MDVVETKNLVSHTRTELEAYKLPHLLNATLAGS